MQLTEMEKGPVIAPSPSEAEQIRAVSLQLAAHPSNGVQYVLTDNENRVHIELPQTLFNVLAQAAGTLAQGRSVAILHLGEELTTQQAADLLQVSRPYLIRLLEEGRIDYHMVGTHRRIKLGDLLAYKRTRDARRRASLEELVRVSESLGLYEDVDAFPITPKKEE